MEETWATYQQVAPPLNPPLIYLTTNVGSGIQKLFNISGADKSGENWNHFDCRKPDAPCWTLHRMQSEDSSATSTTTSTGQVM